MVIGECPILSHSSNWIAMRTPRFCCSKARANLLPNAAAHVGEEKGEINRLEQGCKWGVYKVYAINGEVASITHIKGTFWKRKGLINKCQFD